MANDKKIKLRILRQDAPGKPKYWQNFELPYEPQLNVITCLQRIAELGQTAEGQQVTPVAWDSNCLEEVCGACTMVINGRVRQACSALVDRLLAEDGEVIQLEPMTKFPVIRDLVVDRSRMFDALKRIKAWVPVDGYYDLPTPRLTHNEQEELYPLSRCMTCGCCLEACPQVNAKTNFIGAHAISLAVLYNSHPTGAAEKQARLDALMEKGGLMECGNAQNCVKVCPKEIPLTDSIAKAGRALTFYSIRYWLDR
jgi:succinate dehydrogenase / fumarate reductase iron-sulfur subunit